VLVMLKWLFRHDINKMHRYDELENHGIL